MGIPIFGDIIGAVKDLVSEVVVDKDKKAELQVRLQELEDKADARIHEQILGQLEINKEEAKHGSVFVAGWRPAVGWCCAIALGSQTMVFPLLSAIFGVTFEFDTELLFLTLSGMLGIGAMRSYEKVKGVSTNDYRDTPGR